MNNHHKRKARRKILRQLDQLSTTEQLYRRSFKLSVKLWRRIGPPVRNFNLRDIMKVQPMIAPIDVHFHTMYVHDSKCKE